MSRMKQCAECVGFDSVRLPIEEDEDMVALIEHYLDDHPESPRFKSIVEEYVLTSDCANCGEDFPADVSIGQGSLVREMHCDECISRNKLLKLQVTDVETREFVKRSEEKEGSEKHE